MNFDTKNLDSFTIREIKMSIMKLLPPLSTIDKILIFNIGSARIDFDSFGPILGDMLEHKLKKSKFREISMILDIMGTSNNPCNGLNLNQKYEIVNNTYKELNLFTIATDAAGTLNPEKVNNLFIKDKSIRPSAGANRSFRPIGDMSISMATVLSEGRNTMFFNKYSIQKSKITQVCEIISEIILETIKEKMMEEF